MISNLSLICKRLEINKKVTLESDPKVCDLSKNQVRLNKLIVCFVKKKGKTYLLAFPQASLPHPLFTFKDHDNSSLTSL